MFENDHSLCRCYLTVASCQDKAQSLQSLPDRFLMPFTSLVSCGWYPVLRVWHPYLHISSNLPIMPTIKPFVMPYTATDHTQSVVGLSSI